MTTLQIITRTVIVVAALIVAIFLLAACSATPKPTTPPTETEVVTVTEAADPPDTSEQTFIDNVRANGPAGKEGWSEGGWDEIAHTACELIKEDPASVGLTLILVESGLEDEGRTAEEIEAFGWIFGAGIAYYCPEELETFVEAVS